MVTYSFQRLYMSYKGNNCQFNHYQTACQSKVKHQNVYTPQKMDRARMQGHSMFTFDFKQTSAILCHLDMTNTDGPGAKFYHSPLTVHLFIMAEGRSVEGRAIGAVAGLHTYHGKLRGFIVLL